MTSRPMGRIENFNREPLFYLPVGLAKRRERSDALGDQKVPSAARAPFLWRGPY